MLCGLEGEDGEHYLLLHLPNAAKLIGSPDRFLLFFVFTNLLLLTMACMVHISYDVQTFGLIIMIVSFV